MRDHVDPQPWHVALAHAAVEQFDVFGNVLERRVEFVIEQFEPRHLGVAQIDHHGRALGRFDARFAHGVLERIRRFRRGRLVFFASPHARNLATHGCGAKRKSEIFQEV